MSEDSDVKMRNALILIPIAMLLISLFSIFGSGITGASFSIQPATNITDPMNETPLEKLELEEVPEESEEIEMINEIKDKGIDIQAEQEFKIMKTTDSWWNTSFPYRTEINVTSTNADDLREYQIEVTFNTSDLITDTKMNADCSDIRVVNSSGSEQAFFIDEYSELDCNENDTLIWIQIDKIPANSGKRIYIYYGNTTATSKSDWIDVFNYTRSYPLFIPVGDNNDDNINVSAAFNGTIVEVPGATYKINRSIVENVGSHSVNTTINATAPIYPVSQGTGDSLVPISWASDDFAQHAQRGAPNRYWAYSFVDSNTITIYDGTFATTEDSEVVNAKKVSTGLTIATVADGYRINSSAGPFLLFRDDSGVDETPLYPVGTEYIGWFGRRQYLVAVDAGITVNCYEHDGTDQVHTFTNPGDLASNTAGGSNEAGEAIYCNGTGRFFVNQQADADGSEQVTYVHPKELGFIHVLPQPTGTSTDFYVSVIAPNPNTACNVTRDYGRTNVAKATGGANTWPRPNLISFTSGLQEGDMINCTEPVTVAYDDVENDDENILLSEKASRRYSYPAPTYVLSGIEEESEVSPGVPSFNKTTGNGVCPSTGISTFTIYEDWTAMGGGTGTAVAYSNLTDGIEGICTVKGSIEPSKNYMIELCIGESAQANELKWKATENDPYNHYTVIRGFSGWAGTEADANNHNISTTQDIIDNLDVDGQDKEWLIGLGQLVFEFDGSDLWAGQNWSSTHQVERKTKANPWYDWHLFNLTTGADATSDSNSYIEVNEEKSAAHYSCKLDITVSVGDEDPPAVIINSPSDSDSFNSNFLVNATVTDAGDGVDNASVFYWLENTTGNYTPWINLSNLSSGDVSYFNDTFDISLVLDGMYNVTINATDNNDNENSSESVEITIDTTPPSVVINEPTGTIADHTPTLNITLAETVDTLWYNKSDTTNVTICTDCTGEQIYYLVHEEGSHTVHVFANDSLGNENDSESSAFTVNMNNNYYDTFNDNSSISEITAAEWNEGNVSFTQGASSTAWWNTSFTKRKEINITNAGTTELTDFPAYINVTYDSDMQDDYEDLRFVNISCGVSEDNQTLDYEIENYTASKADIWVRLPTLNETGNTSICMYYGNSTEPSGQNKTGVWDENYMAVWHIHNKTGTTLVPDSTETNDGTMTQSDHWVANGKIDGAYDFYGEDSDDSYSAAEHISLKPENITFSAWVYEDTFTSNWDTVMVKASTDSWNDGYGLTYDDADDADAVENLTFWVNNYASGGRGQFPPLTLDTWYHIVGTYNGSHVVLYIDGVEEDSMSYATPITHSTNSLYVGQGLFSGCCNYEWYGIIDEVRISNVSRSADWVKQSYQIVENQKTYVNTSDEETYSAGSGNTGNFTIYAINTTEDITQITDITWRGNDTDDTNNVTVNLSVDFGKNWYNVDNGSSLSGFTANNSLIYRAFFETDSAIIIYLRDMNISWSAGDSDPPLIDPVAPENNTYKAWRNNITFNGTASDDNADTIWINDSRFTWNGTYESWGFYNNTNITDHGSFQMITVNVTANDTSDNRNSTIINITLDVTYPLIDPLEPANNSVKSWTINATINGTASDANPEVIAINNSAFDWNNSYDGWKFKNNTPLEAGVWFFNITANDSAGNENVTWWNFSMAAPKSISIALSPNLTEGAIWNITYLPITDANSTGNNDTCPSPPCITGYNITIDASGTDVDIYIRANDNLQTPDESNYIKLANESFSNSSTSETLSGIRKNVLTTSWQILNHTMQDSQSIFLKFFLNVSGSQAVALDGYNNTIEIKAVEEGVAP